VSIRTEGVVRLDFSNVAGPGEGGYDMNIRVIYSTEAIKDKFGKAGTQIERSFPSLDEAKAAEFPPGYTFAYIPMEDGRYIYSSSASGWIEEITAKYVEKCVDDWLQRLDDLFKQIKTWAAANGWAAEDGAPTPMREEMMERYGVGERKQPTLFVRSDTGAQIWIKPKGLWVIGANGRVDIYSRKGAYTLVDVGEKFQTPQWVLGSLQTWSDDAAGAPDQGGIRLGDWGLSS
jgi:hypothetical protein